MNTAATEYLRSIAHTREMTLQQAHLTEETLESIITTLKEQEHPDALVLERMKGCIVRTFTDLADAEYRNRQRGLALGLMHRLQDHTPEEVEQLVDSLILEATIPSSQR